ncbi:serpin family protein [Prolixibacteraceae bacterium JC049]|nr:serpin family protein [Prolixibacteraceae bacterium JC049]
MKYAIYLNVFTLFFLFSCQSNDSEDIISTIELSEKSALMVQSQNEFGLSLFQQANLDPEKSKGNVMVSPLSVSQALSMTYNGTANVTKQEFESVLGYSGYTTKEINTNNQHLVDALLNHDSKVDFTVANSIWHRNDVLVKEPFKNTNRTFYDAEIAALDFSNTENVKNKINGWVKDKTRSKIESIIDQVPGNAVMYLVNAIYFKANWQFQFDKKSTEDATFITPSKEVTVPMMKIESTFRFMSNSQYQVVELPYGGGKFNMLLVLPSEQTDINQLIADLQPSDIAAWDDQLKDANLNVHLPRFEFEYENELKEELSNMGLNQAFSPYADFSNMTNASVLISKVLHKTYIKTDEEGSEAAAVTAVEIEFTSALPSSPTVRFNRSFLFFIREKDTNSNLFIGKVINPLLKK